MSTAKTLIDDALLDIEIRSSNITDSEYAQGLRYMNRIMTTWAEEGLNVGYSKVTTITQETHVPDWFEMCLISHLGIALAPSYGVPIDPRRLAVASEMKQAVELRLVRLGPVRYPNSLPTGAGNGYCIGENYFTAQNSSILNSATDSDLSDDEGVDLSV